MTQEWNIPLDKDDDLSDLIDQINAALATLDTSWSGATPPSASNDGRWWLDTGGTPVVKSPRIRISPNTGDLDNSSWPSVPICRVLRLTHAELTETSNGVAQVVDLAELPARYKVMGVTVKNAEAFSGGGIVSLDFIVGTDTDDNIFITSHDGLATPGDTVFTDSSPLWHSDTFASESLILTATPDGAHNLNDLTAGIVDVYVFMIVLPS